MCAPRCRYCAMDDVGVVPQMASGGRLCTAWGMSSNGTRYTAPAVNITHPLALALSLTEMRVSRIFGATTARVCILWWAALMVSGPAWVPGQADSSTVCVWVDVCMRGVDERFMLSWVGWAAKSRMRRDLSWSISYRLNSSSVIGVAWASASRERDWGSRR